MGPNTVQTDTELGAEEKVGTDTELAGKEGEEILAADRGVAEASGMEKVGPGGWQGEKELVVDMEAAGGGSPAGGETDGCWTG